MKTNHIPREARLRSRIIKLDNLENDAWVKFGDGNPYLKCKHCGVSNVEETIDGHHKGCLIRGIKKQIKYYQGLL